MPSFIPFVSTGADVDIFNEVYADAPICRVNLLAAKPVKERLQGDRLWIDGGVDGYTPGKKFSKEPAKPNEWERLFAEIPHGQQLCDAEFVEKPAKQKILDFARALLNRCKAYERDWISIPQLPWVSDNSRNKINKILAEVAGKWYADSKFDGELILPVIFTSEDQYRTRRKDRIGRIMTSLASGASGVWVVHRELNDQEGRRPFVHRFRYLIEFHNELRERLGAKTTVVVGPYWGLNLLLWARGLGDHPAIGLGASYVYRSPNIKSKSGGKRIERVALKGLYRCVRAGGLKAWLKKVVGLLSEEDPARKEFEHLLDTLDALLLKKATRRQIAQGYREWVDHLEEVPANGRAVALHQQLSSAVVLAKGLPAFPEESGEAKRPGIVAKQLMYNCL